MKNLKFVRLVQCWISGFCPPPSTVSQELDPFLSSGGKILREVAVLYGPRGRSPLDNKSIDSIQQIPSSEANRSSAS